MIKKRVLLFIGLFLIFFLDGQLSFFLSSLSGFQWLLVSQLLLVGIFYLSVLGHDLVTYVMLVVLGLFYDQHYILGLGLATFLFPLSYALLSWTRRLWLKGFWDRAFVLFCFHLLFPICLYGLGRVYQLTVTGFEHFLQRQLFGTLIFNSVITLLVMTYVEAQLFSEKDFRQISTEL